MSTTEATTTSTTLGRDLAGRRVIVCIGSGGVGKTTTSAVIALHAAIEGRKVLVLTVDPAKRLANSLGVSELDDTEREIPIEAFAEIGVEPRGQLFAMMLDMKHAFDRLVERHAPDDERRQRILNNRFYRYFSTSLAGTQEYSAMERLYELYEETDFELIVLDTPPTAHALDFLDAPKRMFDAVDSAAFQWLARNTRGNRFGLGIVKMGANVMMKTLSRFTGSTFLEDLGEFIASFGDMWEGFKQRAARVREILGGDDVAFYIITAPDSVSLREANFLFDRLHSERIDVGGYVVNRVHQSFVPQPVLAADPVELDKRLRAAVEAHLEAHPDDTEAAALLDAPDLVALSARMQQSARDFHLLADPDAERIEALRRRLPDAVAIQTVPFFSTDIYSFAGLDRIRRELFELGDALTAAQRVPGRL